MLILALFVEVLELHHFTHSDGDIPRESAEIVPVYPIFHADHSCTAKQTHDSILILQQQFIHPNL